MGEKDQLRTEWVLGCTGSNAELTRVLIAACIAPDYIIVPREKQDALLSAIKKQHDAVFPHGSLEKDDYPRIISDGHFDRLQDSLNKSQGDKVLLGEMDKTKRMMGITVVKDVTWDDELMKK